ncbi:MAG TPA: T9SS C-terminal target domain-containing protein, partial [Bacteroidetes bacterium]|nr:T9SS C-terminal target domain-containing protein [Bacteroidota bacterium]
SQNYPNPFNPITAIDFQLPERSDVQLVIYDVSGREISKLKNEIMDAGYYRINFSGVNLSSGIYFYTLRAGKYS